MSSEEIVVPEGPWLACPWCAGAVPLSHLAESDEEPATVVAVCDSCGRRVSFPGGTR